MSDLPHAFEAFVAERRGDDVVREIRSLTGDQLGDGDVTIRVAWSGVNYKDALATRPGGRVARISPLIPGIDLAGSVVDPGGCGLLPGAPVLAHGYDLGVAHHGGYAEYGRVPSGWLVPLPVTLGTREAMVLGTAGFTAALSVQRLEAHGLRPGDGSVLVTGATGGVGSVAVSILARRGYRVVASTGKSDAADWLRALGAAEVIGRDLGVATPKPLDSERWAGAVDCVGGGTLATVLSTLRYGAAVAASGNTGGPKLAATVFPFILRGVALLGIDSVAVPIRERRAVWQRLATDLRPDLDLLGTDEVALDGLPGALDRIFDGRMRGRTLVRVAA